MRLNQSPQLGIPAEFMDSKIKIRQNQRNITNNPEEV